MSYAKSIGFKVKSGLDTKTERILNENLFFCNTFNLEDDCFVHNSVVSLLLHQSAKNHPKRTHQNKRPKIRGQKTMKMAC